MALVNPNIAMSFKPTTEYQPRNVLAEYAQLQQIQGGQMQMAKLKRDEDALDTMMQNITANGGPEDPMKAAEFMIKSRNPDFMAAGLKIQQTYRETQQTRAALGLPFLPSTGAPAATSTAQPTNALAPTPPISGALGSGTFDPMAPAAQPTNAMVPAAAPVAPVNALAPTAAPAGGMSPELRAIYEKIASPSAAAQAIGKMELEELTKSQVVAPGGTIYQGGKAVYTAPAALGTPSTLARLMSEMNALPTGDPRRAMYQSQINKEITHAPRAVTTVHVGTEKKFGEAFAGKMAEADINKMTAAENAPKLADSANRIIDIVNKGDVFTGPAADIKLNIARALNVAGADNAEKIANTEILIAAAGQSTLDVIKTAGLGTGQGFTDKDLIFLQGIAGGTANLTPKTLTELARLQHLAATRSADSWNKRVKQIPKSAIEGTGLSMEPITVPPLSSGKRAAPSAPVVPAVGTVQEGYRYMGGNPADSSSWRKQ
jgi:hypothetical protein